MTDQKKEKIFQAVNLVAVLAAGALLGFIVVQMLKRGSSAETVEARTAAPLFTAQQTQAVPQQSPAQDAAPADQPLPAPPVQLSQRARVLATEFHCPCGCSMILSDCTCSKTPGQRDAKSYLQAMVDQNKNSEEIREAMRQRFGGDIILGAK